MDALSKIFDDIHLAQSEYLHIKLFPKQRFVYEHAPYMLAYVLVHGNARLYFKDGNILHLEQGDLILLPSGMQHHIQSSNTSCLPHYRLNDYFQSHRQQCLEFKNENEQIHTSTLILAIRSKLDMQMARPLLNALPSYVHIQHILGDTTPEWLQVGLQFLAIETQQHRPGRDKILDHLVSILLIECVRDYILNLKDTSNWLNALSHPELANALAMIHEHPERAWTVEALANECHMSRSKFALLFNQIVGETPLAYLQQHRLRLAAQYLRDGNLSIQQIAHAVGYSAETAFSQSFKKQYELSPSIYRQQFQKPTS